VRINIAVVLCLQALLVSVLSYAEPSEQPRIYFAGITMPDESKAPFLLGSFKPGVDVNLLNEKEICKAKTGHAFLYESSHGPLKATRLIGVEKCQQNLLIAVVGHAAESVQLLTPEKDPTPVSKTVERRARRIVAPYGATKESWGVSSAPPETMIVGRFTLLKFALNDPDCCRGKGPRVLYADGRFFELHGDCVEGPVFFSVYDKLHIAYIVKYWGKGVHVWAVDDLSGKKPKDVYGNSDMSD
jgi:hypothetical protein